MKFLKMLLWFVIVGGLILVLLIFLVLIKGVINECEVYCNEVY